MNDGIRIVVTAKWASKNLDWIDFCAAVGLEYYALNEGLDPDTEFNLTLQDAIELGVFEGVLNK